MISRRLTLTTLMSMFCLAVSYGTTTAARHLDAYSSFDSLGVADMDSLRVKLTYGGPQDYPVRSIGIAVAGVSMRRDEFTRCVHAGFDYHNDEYALDHFTSTPLTLRRMIKQVGAVRGVRRGGADTDSLPYLSFALVCDSNGTTRCFDAIVGAIRGRALFTTLLKAFESDSALAGAVETLGLECAFLPMKNAHRSRH